MTSIFPSGSISKNPQLQRDLERLYHIRSASSRILSIAQNPSQRLEAAKSFLVSHLELLTCMRVVQRERVAEALRPNSDNVDVSPATATDAPNTAQFNRASLCISYICIPLVWRNVTPGVNMQLAMNKMFPSLSNTSEGYDKLEDDQSNGYSVFCTIQVGDIVKDTNLAFNIRPGTGYIEFDGKWIFNNVDDKFRCVIDIYAYPKPNQRSVSMFSRRRSTAYELLSRSTEQPESNSMTDPNWSNCFDLVGRCVLDLQSVRNETIVHNLELNPQLTFHHEFLPCTTPAMKSGSPNEICDIPLFGNICCKVFMQPNSIRIPLKTGYMWIRKLTSSPVQHCASLYNCELRDCFIRASPISGNNIYNESRVNEPAPSPKKSVKKVEQVEAISSNEFPGASNNEKHISSEPSITTNPTTQQPIVPNLMIPIHQKTHILDSRPVLRSISLFQPACIPVHSCTDNQMSESAAGSSHHRYPSSNKPNSRSMLDFYHHPPDNNHCDANLSLEELYHRSEASSHLSINKDDDDDSLKRTSESSNKSPEVHSLFSLTTSFVSSSSTSPKLTNHLTRSLDCVNYDQPHSTDSTRLHSPPGTNTAFTESDSTNQLPAELYTFRIGTYSTASTMTANQTPSFVTNSDTNCDVFEFAVTKPWMVSEDTLPSSRTNILPDKEETDQWFKLIKAHIEEQATWDFNSSSKSVDRPPADSGHVNAVDIGSY